MTLTRLSYKSLTLEDIDGYYYHDFVCDGDKGEIICVLKEI